MILHYYMFSICKVSVFLEIPYPSVENTISHSQSFVVSDGWILSPIEVRKTSTL